MTKFPVNSVADIQGKKIRAVGYIGKLIKGVGAAPVSVPNAEIYTTLERGTADGLVMAPYKALLRSVLCKPVCRAFEPAFWQFQYPPYG